MSNRPGAVRHHRRLLGARDKYIQSLRACHKFNRRYGGDSHDWRRSWCAWMERNGRRDTRREWRRRQREGT